MAPKEPMRRDRFPSGIAGVSVGEIERQVPAGEAPPLPPNDRLTVIGKPVPRINGRAKVTGAARFTVDIKLAGMLHGRLLRSPHPHARIVSIDTQAAERHPDVRAVHVITDIVGRAIERTPRPARRRSVPPRALCRSADRGRRGNDAGGRGSGAEPDQNRIRGIAVRRRHGRCAQTRRSCGLSFAGCRLQLCRRRARRSGASAARKCARTHKSRHARRREEGFRRGRRDVSRANTARRCRRIAAWKPMRSSPIGGRTA